MAAWQGADAEDLKDSSAFCGKFYPWMAQKRLKLNYGAKTCYWKGIYSLIKKETLIIPNGESLLSEYKNPFFGFDTAHLGKSFFGF